MQAGRPPTGDTGGERARRRLASRKRAIRLRRRAALGTALAAAVAVAVVFAVATGSHGRGRAAALASEPASALGRGARGTSTPGAKGAPGEETPQVRALIALGKPIYCAARRGNEVALTFDDGPGPYTQLMLAKLRKHHVPATFFDVGRNIPLVAQATRQEREAGGLGDHTFTHPLLTALAPGEAEDEIVKTKLALERSSGAPVFLFRPPYGGRNETIDRIASSHGLLEILWTVDSADSLGAEWNQIERNVIEGLHGGAIILMHENHGQTVRAMLGIFAALQRLHIRPVSVAQLLSDDPPSAAQVRAGGAACGVDASRLTGS
jgi:peptidoglycan/xylan/chitin deacetylase (PgdA/CDA1 family)